MLTTLTIEEVSTFPYPKPWGELPWQPITAKEDLPFETWVWLADRLHNIYPGARTAKGLEVPNHLDLPARYKSGLLDKPILWLPWKPDQLALVIGQHLPRILRRTRPNYG